MRPIGAGERICRSASRFLAACGPACSHLLARVDGLAVLARRQEGVIAAGMPPVNARVMQSGVRDFEADGDDRVRITDTPDKGLLLEFVTRIALGAHEVIRLRGPPDDCARGQKSQRDGS